MDLAADLSVADRARLDRLAISSTLQDLGCLTQQRIGHVERPKRLSRDALARRVAKFREQTPLAERPVTQAPTPEPPLTETQIMKTPVVETPVAEASVTKPLVGQTPVREPQVAENSTPPRSPESVSAHIQDLVDSQLAELLSNDILLAASAAATGPPSFAQASPSAHGGQTFTSWLRRSIAPLVSFFKTADIPQ